MPTIDGKNHDRMVASKGYDIFILGEENKDKLEKYLYEIGDVDKTQIF